MACPHCQVTAGQNSPRRLCYTSRKLAKLTMRAPGYVVKDATGHTSMPARRGPTPSAVTEVPLVTQSGLCPLLSPQRAKTRCGWPLSGVLNSC